MNITDTIEPKVDQLTADHLIGRTLTICITGVHLAPGEQPCEIHYEGENGLPYRPGKSMRRVLVHIWGADVTKYVGRSMTLYRDDDVQFGGLKVGGVRISHMSDIREPVTMALTAKKGSKKAFKVLPLKVEAPKPQPAADKVAEGVAALVQRVRTAPDMAALQTITAEAAVVKQRAWLVTNRPDLAAQVDDAVRAALEVFDPPQDGDGEAGTDAPAAGEQAGLGLP